MTTKTRRRGRPKVRHDGEKRQFLIIYTTDEEAQFILTLSTEERKHALLTAAIERARRNLQPPQVPYVDPQPPAPEPETVDTNP